MVISNHDIYLLRNIRMVEEPNYKTIWGIAALGHDASISVIKESNIVFAAHSERYSRIKNDDRLNDQIINEALQYGYPDKIVWHEKPYLKKVRQAMAGQWSEVFNKEVLPERHLKKFLPKLPPIEYALHHKSHAAAGAYTSPFNEATVVVLDAIGEFNTCSIWKYNFPNTLTKIETSNYPSSFGLLYSAFTQRCGLKPNEEEYILMGMAAYGEPKYAEQIKKDFIRSMTPLKLKQNVHAGIGDYLPEASKEDLSASIQAVAEEFVVKYCEYAMDKTGVKDLVYMGGVALNCVANTKLLDVCESIWIMPNPGDSGNSLGAALLGQNFISLWPGPFLGTNIPGIYPVKDVIKELETNQICGVAHGRAEFGPRALGNRSLLADPRGQDIKDKVNSIKKRQKFRPFAPVILAEELENYFEINTNQSPYMQFTAKAKPDTIKNFPAIVHADGTARVQTVTAWDNPGLRRILEVWFEKTKCPMLLNTSLNIRGEPLVNTEQDALNFQHKYGIKVISRWAQKLREVEVDPAGLKIQKEKNKK